MADEQLRLALAALATVDYLLNWDNRAQGIAVYVECLCCREVVWSYPDYTLRGGARLDVLLLATEGHTAKCERPLRSMRGR